MLDLAADGGHDLHDSRPTREPVPRWVSCHLPGRVQGADVAVAQRVEDVLDLLAGRGDRADVSAPALSDPVP